MANEVEFGVRFVYILYQLKMSRGSFVSVVLVFTFILGSVLTFTLGIDIVKSINDRYTPANCTLLGYQVSTGSTMTCGDCDPICPHCCYTYPPCPPPWYSGFLKLSIATSNKTQVRHDMAKVGPNQTKLLQHMKQKWHWNQSRPCFYVSSEMSPQYLKPRVIVFAITPIIPVVILGSILAGLAILFIIIAICRCIRARVVENSRCAVCYTPIQGGQCPLCTDYFPTRSYEQKVFG